MLGRRIPAARALEIGLVHQVVPRDQLRAAVDALLAELARLRAALGAVGEVGDRARPRPAARRGARDRARVLRRHAVQRGSRRGARRVRRGSAAALPGPLTRGRPSEPVRGGQGPDRDRGALAPAPVAAVRRATIKQLVARRGRWPARCNGTRPWVPSRTCSSGSGYVKLDRYGLVLTPEGRILIHASRRARRRPRWQDRRLAGGRSRRDGARAVGARAAGSEAGHGQSCSRGNGAHSSAQPRAVRSRPHAVAAVVRARAVAAARRGRSCRGTGRVQHPWSRPGSCTRSIAADEPRGR